MRRGSVKASRANRWNLWLNAGFGRGGAAAARHSGARAPASEPGIQRRPRARLDSGFAPFQARPGMTASKAFLDSRLRGNERRLGGSPRACLDSGFANVVRAPE